MASVRTRRLLLWVALPTFLLVGLYTVLGFWLVPRLVRSNVHDFVALKFHREVAIGDIRFNPFALRLEVRDFSLPDSDGKPMLAFGHLLLDLTIASLWRLGPDFETILLEQPYARVLIKPDGTLNLSDLALPASPHEQPQPNAKPARLFINHFSMQGGNLAFEDQAHASAFRTEIKPITFDLRNFSTVGKGSGSYELNGTSDAGETFGWSGSLNSFPLASQGRFEVGHLQARTLSNYLRDSVHFELPSGVISLNGDYDFTAATQPIGLAVNVHEVTLTDLGIRPKGVADDYVKLARLEVHNTRADVAKRTLTAQSVRLSGGEIRAWVQAPGAVNLLELVGPPAPAPTTAVTIPSPPGPSPAGSRAPPTAAPAEAAPWVVSVPDIALDDFKISAEDRQVSPAVSLRLDALSVKITGFTTAATTPVAVAMSTRINGDAKFDAKADLSADLAAAKIQAQLAGLDLTMLQPYITRQTSMTLRGGRLSTKLNVDRGADGRLGVTGEAEVAKLRTVDNVMNKDFIKFDRLQVNGIDYEAHPGEPAQAASLHIHDIIAHEPYARVIIESDQTVNVQKVLSGPNGGQAAQSPDPGEPTGNRAATQHRAPADHAMAIAVDAIKIENGSANYADFWIQPHFAVGIQSLNGSVLGLSSNARARAKVELQGKVDRYAPVHIWGETNPLAATAFTDIKMSFKGVELSSATPYSGHFAGYKIQKGKLSVDIGYKIENRQLTAAHRFVIDQLELGDRVESPDAVHLPLKIAIALLKDRNGVIDLDLPVTGSLDDPKFRLAPIIWKAFVNVLTKIVTAPFAALGHLFGGGEQMNFIDFRPGSAQLESSEHDKLTALVKALQEKNKLELDVPVTVVPEIDRPGLAAARLDERLLEIKSDQATGHKHAKPAAKTNTAAAPPAGPDSTAATSTPTPQAQNPPVPADPALTDPPQRYQLLVALYRAELGKAAALPDTAQAIESAKKKVPPPDFGAANAALEAPLLQKMAVTDGELESLGKHRARAIQDVLLLGTDIDPARVFVIGSAPKSSNDKDKVRVELALK